jgi:hypothetical protein
MHLFQLSGLIMHGSCAMTMIKRASGVLLLLNLMTGNSFAAIAHKFTASSGRTYPDSGLDMVNACVRNHVTCVIDFTSHIRCTAKASENDVSDEDFGKTLDKFVAKCPAYRWNKNGHVYVIEPRAGSDSVLNVQVEKVSGVRTAEDVMHILVDSSGLGPDASGILDGHSLSPGMRRAGSGPFITSPDTRRRVAFTLPAATLKKSLIAAARQSQPSYWLVHYKKDGAAAESLDFNADTYGMPKSGK